MLENETLPGLPSVRRRPRRAAILLMGDTLGLGGTEGQFVELASRLDRSMWDVHVSCIRAEGPLRARLETAGVRAWSCGRGSLKSLGVLARVCGLARYLRHARIDLVHTFDFYSNVVGGVAARLARVPAVLPSPRGLRGLRPRLGRRPPDLMLRM